jgi:hypothetical protein
MVTPRRTLSPNHQDGGLSFEVRCSRRWLIIVDLPILLGVLFAVCFGVCICCMIIHTRALPLVLSPIALLWASVWVVVGTFNAKALFLIYFTSTTFSLNERGLTLSRKCSKWKWHSTYPLERINMFWNRLEQPPFGTYNVEMWLDTGVVTLERALSEHDAQRLTRELQSILETL